MRRVIGIGAGGHAKVLVEALLLSGNYEVVGLLDNDSSRAGERILGVPVIGDDSLLPMLRTDGLVHAFIGVGTVGPTSERSRVSTKVLNAGFTLVCIVHPGALVSHSAQLQAGVAVLAGAIVGVEARVGKNAIVNTGAIIEHDCVIGEDSHVATGARLGGAVILEEGVHVGIGATVRQNIHVGARAVIGAGAVVVHNVPPGDTVVGVPARRICSQ